MAGYFSNIWFVVTRPTMEIHEPIRSNAQRMKGSRIIHAGDTFRLISGITIFTNLGDWIAIEVDGNRYYLDVYRYTHGTDYAPV